MTRTCDACGGASLVPFADLGEIPVFCGVHWASRDEALASPLGAMELAYCPECAYVRNLAFDPAALVYDATMDTNLHHSPAFQTFSAKLVKHLVQRYPLAGASVLDIGCGQGEFLRELCHVAGAGGHGYDAMYAGPTGPDPSGAIFHAGHAPLDDSTPEFDFVTSGTGSSTWTTRTASSSGSVNSPATGPYAVIWKFRTPVTTSPPPGGR